VLPIAGAYIAVAWLVTEIAGFLLQQAGAPPWSLRLLAIVFVVGFPAAVALAWVIQLQPDGKRAFDPSLGQGRIVMGVIVIALLATAGLAWLILPRIEDTPAIPEYQPLPNSVAVLPLEVNDGTPNERTVAETLYTALLQGLNQSAELTQVRLRLKELPRDLPGLGRRMRVVGLLGGRTRRLPGGIRVEMELLDVARDRLRWSQTFEWDSTRIMETGTAIANGVLAAMNLPVITRQKFAGTDNRDAYDALLLGQQQFSSLNVNDVAAAVESFQRAIDLDPGYVRAYSSLGAALKMYGNVKGPSESERQSLNDRARQALERAMELDSNSADAISALAWISPEPQIRLRLLEHALELNPRHELSYHRLGWTMWTIGNLDKAARLFRKALELDPMNANQHHDLGELLWESGQPANAIAEINRSIELEPKMTENYQLLGLIQLWSYGRIDQSIIFGRKAYSLDPDAGAKASFLAGAYAGLGAREESLLWLNRGLQISPTSGWSFNMAYLCHLMLGDEAVALEYVRRLLEADPSDHRALFFLGQHDIGSGRAELALERWRRAYPNITFGDNPACNASNYHVLVAYADNLMQAGHADRAKGLLQKCLPVLKQLRTRAWPEAFLSRSYALLGRKQAALKALHKEFIDDHRRIEALLELSQPEYDFLRDEPEFQRLVAIVKKDLADQLHRIREMERKGELPPAPGVSLPASRQRIPETTRSG